LQRSAWLHAAALSDWRRIRNYPSASHALRLSRLLDRRRLAGGGVDARYFLAV
jgi:hypothetical protein